MTPKKKLEQFAQSIYLTIKNRYFDEIDQEDGQVYVAQVADWTNMFLDELENETDPSGQVVDWSFAREDGAELGTATQGDASIGLPTSVDRLLADEQRYVQISQDGSVVSNWAVVQAKDITNKRDRVTEDMCAVVGSNIVFSRAFTEGENNGTITGDVVNKMPRIVINSDGVPTNVKILDFVKPKQLLILGVAKNATLPDIVQGGLSPSYNQKFDTLLAGAVARSMASSRASLANRDSYSNVRGV